MADPEAQIRELKKRVDREPGSRFFVPLADEYRRAGRLPEAIAALETGLTVHGGYVAARVALARAYLEAGRIEDSIAAFSRALADDPSNLVAAKALGDLHVSRGEPLQALKRYLRYRAISGDRRLDDVIARLERETAAPPVAEAAIPHPPPPPPPERPVAEVSGAPLAVVLPDPLDLPPVRRETDPHDISGVTWERPVLPDRAPAVQGEPELPSRDLALDGLASASEGEAARRRLRLPEPTWPFEPPEPAQPAPEPTGRTLADLYFEQGHFAEAAAAYSDLLATDPDDPELARRREESAGRARAAAPPDLPSADPGRERRLRKIRVLNEWLAVIQTAASDGRVR
jgi:tetratricopeptide (TPR) repeat protein